MLMNLWWDVKELNQRIDVWVVIMATGTASMNIVDVGFLMLCLGIIVLI